MQYNNYTQQFIYIYVYCVSYDTAKRVYFLTVKYNFHHLYTVYFFADE